MIFSILDEKQRKGYLEKKDLDFGYTFNEKNRLNLRFEKGISGNEFYSYEISEIKKGDTETSPRFTLIFKDNDLIAVFFTRSLNLKNQYNSGKIDGNYSYIFFTEINEKTKEKLSHIYFKKITN
jgi:hypothetical protein